MNIADDYIAAELKAIGERLAAGPDPFLHAGLYTAQQALCWAVQPKAFASPLAVVTGSAATQECCSEQSRPTPS
jgi:hypothetical protein